MTLSRGPTSGSRPRLARAATEAERAAFDPRRARPALAGILEGPRVRYVMPGVEEWRTSQSWPPAASHRPLALRADTVLGDEDAQGERSYLTISAGQRLLPGTSALSLPDRLEWNTQVLADDVEVAGEVELELTATTTAFDTGWIALLEDVAPDGSTTAVTQGWLRASLRETDDTASRPGRPVLPLRTPHAVTPGQKINYRIPLVPTARLFKTGHRIRLTLTSDDTGKGLRVMEGFTHTSVGSSSVNTVHGQSRLLLPVTTEHSP
ncbi:MAG TPA: CocE/NonD family hydrolase C-terminal non-catalytic domain-containing protein [Mycobacterium sp.]|nr:CocE/NonD family hydrolase C-terminal non-catalytic domain-containing protein [Mycobacterium sp.]